MSISFQEFDVQQFRAEIDENVRRRVDEPGSLSSQLVLPGAIAPRKSTFDIQLGECRAEWRRRHPPTEQSGRDVELSGTRTRDRGDAPERADLFIFSIFFAWDPQGEQHRKVVEEVRDRAGLPRTLPARLTGTFSRRETLVH